MLGFSHVPIKPLRAALAALALLTAVCLSGAAEAGPGWAHARIAHHWAHARVAAVHHVHHRGRTGAHRRRSVAAFAAPGLTDGAPAIAVRAAWGADAAAWRAGAEALDEAGRWIGGHNPTGFNGPWCKAFTNFVLERLGFHPGPSLLAIDALKDGERVAEPRPGDLVVLRTRRGAAGHVGFVESVGPDDRLTIVSGNWGRRVARAVVPRRAATAFVRT